MEEGRLGTVLRQEERHRKFVYMMNDIGRTRLGLYNNFLVKEQHENSTKMVKNFTGIRRSIVRQKVLRQCLEMRRSKVTARDGPYPSYGQYGGKPLWTMNRDIDKVIADNHPRLRRLKRVQEVMRQSLECGAILDDDAISRRVKAFFQLKQHSRGPGKTDDSPHRPPPLAKDLTDHRDNGRESRPRPPSSHPPQDPLKSFRQRKFKAAHRLPPIGDSSRGGVATTSAGSEPSLQPSVPAHAPRELPHPRTQDGKTITDSADDVSLKTDSIGRLRSFKLKPIPAIEELKEDEEDENLSGDEDGIPSVKRKEDSSVDSGLRELSVTDATSDNDSDSNSDKDKRNRQYNKANDLSKPRRKLILPPIQTTKALVSRN